MRLWLDYGAVFMVNYSDLRSIRSFGRYLLGFLRVGEWEGVILGWIMVVLGWDGW